MKIEVNYVEDTQQISFAEKYGNMTVAEAIELTTKEKIKCQEH